MVLSKDLIRNKVHDQVQRSMRHSSTVSHKKHDSGKKNELLYPISPYDEMPTIRDLSKQLAPDQRQNSGVQRNRKEMTQARQDAVKKNHRHGGRQQRDGITPPFDEFPSFSRFRNDAHGVPSMIEMPTTPSYSEDSEVSIEECLRRSEEDYRDKRSLRHHLPDAHDFDSQPKPFHLQCFSHTSVNHELDWPSDEDNAPQNKRTTMTKERKKNAKKLNHCHQVRFV